MSVCWGYGHRDCAVLEGLGADSEEKHEPASDTDTVVDSLKALDLKRPIREADIAGCLKRATTRHKLT
jgi:hypothetical protein